jgi:hypothetical protein
MGLWLLSVISATQEVEMEGLGSEASLSKKLVRPHLNNKLDVVVRAYHSNYRIGCR